LILLCLFLMALPDHLFNFLFLLFQGLTSLFN
jgi:hypothetical protein